MKRQAEVLDKYRLTQTAVTNCAEFEVKKGNSSVCVCRFLMTFEMACVSEREETDRVRERGRQTERDGVIAL